MLVGLNEVMNIETLSDIHLICNTTLYESCLSYLYFVFSMIETAHIICVMISNDKQDSRVYNHASETVPSAKL